MDKGLIFDIERFSTKDGPGIRTVVFFKGCNMSCYWCHNPEGIKGQPELRFYPDKCKGCGCCVSSCVMRAHKIENGSHVIDDGLCRSCYECADNCHYNALVRVGKWMDVEEVYAEIEEDRIFYKHSNGGVTLSGGEVLCQIEFAQRLLKRCHDNSIHTAIESNLSHPWDKLERVIPYLDLVMGDIKHMDEALHRKGTGAGNREVLNNIKKLDSLGVPMIIRTPIVPGFNNTKENISKTAVFLKDISSLLYYELLSYNPLANSKGILINNPGKQHDISVPGKKEMEQLADVALEYGIDVYVDGHKRSI